MKRRSFLKLLGGTAAAAVAAPLIAPSMKIALPPAAPLFVPAQHLEMGVPTGRLLTAREAPAADLAALWERQAAKHEALRATYDARRTIPMLLVQSEYLIEYGGKLPAGSQVMVDRETAERWTRNGVAAPAPTALRDLQEASAQRLAERAQTMRRENHFLDADEISFAVPIGARGSRRVGPALSEADRDKFWGDMIERASAKIKDAARSPDMDWWDA